MTRPAVLVTGGAKRLGAAIARRFGENGWQVLVHYRRSAEAAESLAGQLHAAEIIRADLAEDDGPEQLAEEAVKRAPNWQVLVNCASVFEPDDVRSLDRQVYDRAMRVNARAPARLAQEFLLRSDPALPRRVIQVTDQKLANPNPDFFSYTMSKHALDATIAMLAMGAAGPRDRIYGLAPGAILPSHDQSQEEAERSHRMNPLERRTDTGEIADAALFLAAGWLASGHTIYVDSGQHLLDQPRDVMYLARQQGGATT